MKSIPRVDVHDENITSLGPAANIPAAEVVARTK